MEKTKLNPHLLELGREMTDSVTGFIGIATSKIEYLTGCTQYSLKAKVKEGKIQDTQWFDWQRLTVTGKGVLEDIQDIPGYSASRELKNGGPCPNESMPEVN